MRNDHKGFILHDSANMLTTFFASGSKGNEVRANGRGGRMARGYWASLNSGPSIGPYTCRKAARNAGMWQVRENHRARGAA